MVVVVDVASLRKNHVEIDPKTGEKSASELAEETEHPRGREHRRLRVHQLDPVTNTEESAGEVFQGGAPQLLLQAELAQLLGAMG